jgi:glycosyltransferase involved in cell wall biosynthesis
VTLVPNAVDVAAYRAPQPRPRDLPAGPVAVYVGTVHTDRMDLDLVRRTASGLAGRGHLVLVGPAPLAAGDRRLLLDAGVVMTGPKKHHDVPAYLQHADVLVVPHVVTAFTDSLDPIKVYEYRAAGRPVVSTPVAGFRERAGGQVTLASGDTFVAAVRERLSSPPRAFTEQQNDDVPSWADRVVAVRAVLDRVSAR